MRDESNWRQGVLGLRRTKGSNLLKTLLFIVAYHGCTGLNCIQVIYAIVSKYATCILWLPIHLKPNMQARLSQSTYRSGFGRTATEQINTMAGSSIYWTFCAIDREGEGGWRRPYKSRGPRVPLEALNHMPTFIKNTFLNFYVKYIIYLTYKNPVK